MNPDDMSVTDRNLYRALLDDLDRIAFGFDYEAGEFGLDRRRVHIGMSPGLSASIWIEPEDYSDPTDNEPVNIAHVGLDGRLKLLNNFKIGVTDLTDVELDKEGLTFEDAKAAASVVFAELVEAGYSDPSAP